MSRCELASHGVYPSADLLQMVRSVLRHHQEAIARKEQQGRDERQRLKKIANTIAKEVKQFWDSINRVRM